MTEKKKHHTVKIPIDITGTRNAVETAIDISKGEKSGMWASRAKKETSQISRWPLTSSEKNESP